MPNESKHLDYPTRKHLHSRWSPSFHLFKHQIHPSSKCQDCQLLLVTPVPMLIRSTGRRDEDMISEHFWRKLSAWCQLWTHRCGGALMLSCRMDHICSRGGPVCSALWNYGIYLLTFSTEKTLSQNTPSFKYL